MSKKPKKYGQPWTRDELIPAFDLYCRIPFRATKASHPHVIELAQRLQRSAAGVARKLGNFGAFDPALRKQDIVGLTHGSKLDREVWDEFHADWPALVERANDLRMGLRKERLPSRVPEGPSERSVVTKQRLHQAFFREAVLGSYEHRCCITGIPIPEVLVASHIIPWSQSARLRADPTNGICLSATFDRMFDRGLLAITSELRIELAGVLFRVEHVPTQRMVLSYHNQLIERPSRFAPNTEYLDWHRKHVFRG